MKKSILVGIISIVALVAMTAAVGLQDDIYTYEGKLGKVTFDHKAHVELGGTCKSCHHTLAEDNGMPEKKCMDCHTTDSDVKAKDAYHKNCIDCHKTEKAGPIKCKECHVK